MTAIPSILLVDDDPDILESLSYIVSRKGYLVHTALTGADALLKVDQHAPAVALVDLRLQEMSGLDLMRQIRECCPGTQTIIGTGHTSKAAAIEATNLGAFAYVEKPYDIEDLLVTIRRAVEKQEAEETIAYQARLLQNISDAVIATDPESRIKSWNKAAEKIYGWQASEVIGLPVDEILRPELSEPQRQEIQNQLLADRVWRGEVTHQHRDGSALHMATSATLLQDRDGRPAGTVTISHDITSRVKMEGALQASEERYRRTIQQMPYPVEVCDADGTARVVNQAFLDMFRIPSADLVVGRLNLFEDPVSARLGLAEDIRRVYHGETVFVPRVALPSTSPPNDYSAPSSEAVTYQDVTMFPVFRESGEVWQVVTIWKDITDRVQAELEREQLLSEVRAQASRIQQIMDTVPEGVVLIGADGQIVLANPTAERHLLLLADARPGDILTHMGDRALAQLLMTPKEGLWHEVAAKDSLFEVIARPIETEEVSEQWVLVIRDVTQEREAEQQVQQQERLAAVGQLAAGIAHDFNNIMATIILYAQLSAREEELSEQNRRRMETVRQQAVHASNLIQQILDFTRRTVLDRQILDLVPLLKEQVQLLRRTLPESIAVKMAFGADEYTISGDLTRMRQVIVNLAVNARDAMPEGGDLRIELSRVRFDTPDAAPKPDMSVGEWVRVCVTDTGTGIAADALPHIFDPFFTTKEPGQGTGLGLAQVHGIVASHQGFIDVQTDIGRGTTFAIYLPALEAVRTTTAELGLSSLITGNGQTVLLVEDNRDARSALADSLKLMNYQVVETTNGREALEVLTQRADEIALVLSDVVMPEMSGTTLLQAMRSRELTIPIVMLTGHMPDQELEGLRSRGIADWIPKPPNLEQLSSVIAHALEKP